MIYAFLTLSSENILVRAAPKPDAEPGRICAVTLNGVAHVIAAKTHNNNVPKFQS